METHRTQTFGLPVHIHSCITYIASMAYIDTQVSQYSYVYTSLSIIPYHTKGVIPLLDVQPCIDTLVLHVFTWLYIQQLCYMHSMVCSTA